MEEAEHSRYVTQLKAEFDSCDTTATGFLDRDELTALCQKLHLDAHLPLLLDTLLGERTYARVNFEEFKEGFVAVLSRSLDFSTSEDDSSYLEPGETSTDSPPGVRRAKLRRSTSLDSVEGPQQEKVELDVVIGAGGGGVLCDHLGQQQVNTEVRLHPQPAGNRKLNLIWLQLSSFKQEVDELDGRGSIKQVLCGSAPISCSTPVRSADLQRAPHRSPAVLSTSPSLLTATVGQRVLSRLDDGSGCTSPERVIALWTEEGIRNSRDILQTLDFPLEERLSLADLTLALDNELLVSGSGIHQAALISYKNEIQHLLVVAEQACRERDKVKENRRLEDELSAMKLKLSEAEIWHFGPGRAGLSHEERFSKIVKEYELQFRVRRQRGRAAGQNDELSSELELLKSQRNDRKFRHSAGNDNTNEHALSWNEQRTDSAESRLCIQTELALQHLEQKHKDELQAAQRPAGDTGKHCTQVTWHTQVNYYERSLELMRQSMEVERKDISQAFKLEISELEEQKAQVEQEVKQLKETLSKLQTEVRHGGGGGWSNEQERRTQRERAELEQNFAREIGNLVQRLSAEKDQLEAELKLKMDQEVMLVRWVVTSQTCQRR
ncbi:Ninein-like protein [Nibea albiflora]|uniref:Ninein-like protein n=1 Tax=Nibea albiflora TaxID=240163 RepID=A0ACB7EEW7_NIBAL|nr:Ninein-like protein [Nibea albiflora]